MITANMATIPERTEIAIKAINSIYDQVSVVRLYLNNFKNVPSEFKDDKIQIHQGKDLCSSGKVFWAKNPNEYYFCIDDDILYPSDYVINTVDKLNKYNDDVVISYHGRSFQKDKKIENYFEDHIKYISFKGKNRRDTEVDIIGNGVSCWNTNKIKIDIDKFPCYYMDDILVSAQANAQGKKRIVVSHEEDYFQSLERLKSREAFKESLSVKYYYNNSTQTEMFNSINWNYYDNL